MPSKCRVCIHPMKSDIERMYLLNEPLVRITERYGISRGSVSRHRKHVVVIEGAEELIKSMAAEGKTEHSIAAALGLPRQRYTELKKARPEWLLAWEAGAAAHEQHLAEMLESCTLDKNKRNPIPVMFALKARYGWVEKQYDHDRQPAQPNVMVILPGAMNPDTYLAQVKGRRLPALKSTS